MLVLLSCDELPVTIQHNDPLLTSEKGKIYYDGNLYSGVVEEKNEQGVLIVKDSIANGEKNGTCYKWWPNGNQKLIARFENGDYHGEVTNYYESGQTFSVFHYDHGYESGLQQMWKSDGRIEMNYEVINGRKYGLTGVKNCVNVFEDEGHTF